VKPYSFYELLPNGKMRFFVDATLLKDFGICERRFWYRHIQRQKRKPRLIQIQGQKTFETTDYLSFPIAIGGWWSDVMERFYNLMKDNVPITDDVVKEIVLKAWVDNRLDLGNQIDPKKFTKFGDLLGAVVMLKEYKDSQYSIDKSIWKIVGTEMGFGLRKEVFVGETNKVEVYWVGRPDLGVIESGRLLPVDHKTVNRIDGRTTGRFKPGLQMPGYCFSFETIAKELGIDRRVDRCVVNICARERPSDNPRDGKKKPRFVRAYPTFTREEIEEWRRNVVNTCERIAHCLRTQEWQWGYSSCHNIFMRDCEYLEVDDATPMARDLILKASYVVGEPWIPYVKPEEEGDEE